MAGFPDTVVGSVLGTMAAAEVTPSMMDRAVWPATD